MSCERRRGIALVLGLVLAIPVIPTAAAGQTLADYTAQPPFVAETVTPNVLILLANSGSLDELAHPSPFDPTATYAGLFDSAECYDHQGSGSAARFVPDPAANPGTMPVGGWTCAGKAPYSWSGHLLNYATTRRIDVSKRALVGGICVVSGPDGCERIAGQQDFLAGACCANQTVSLTRAQAADRIPDARLPAIGDPVVFHMVGRNATLRGSFCLDDDLTSPGDAASSCGDVDGYVETGYSIKVDLLTPSKGGVVQAVGSKVRLGLMTLNDQDGGQVVADVGSPVADVVTAVEQTVANAQAPVGEALYEAMRYFAQLAPSLMATVYSYTDPNRDPYYFASMSQQVGCCQSVVLVFSDGTTSHDDSVPGSILDYGHGVHGVHCLGAGCSGHRTDYAGYGSHALDDVAFWGHTNDLRQSTVPVIGEAGKSLDGDQRVTVFTFSAFAGPGGRELLLTTAKLGGFEDRNGNGLPDLQEEWDRLDNVTLASSPDGLPDTFFEAPTAEQIEDRLNAAVARVLQRSAAGSSASVLNSSATGDGAVLQSFFSPSTFEGLREVTWTGYTQGLFVDQFGNLREDTNGDGRLVYEHDKIVATRYDAGSHTVLVDRFDDADGDGRADSATPIATVGLKEVQSLWEAGVRLAQASATGRKILTWIDQDADGVVDGGEQLAFSTTNASLLSPYLRPASAPYTADNIIEFVRGEQIAGLRDRRLTVGGTLQVWKLGDAIHAAPVVVGSPAQRYDLLYGDASYTAFVQRYQQRRQVAYVGANDGMLHGFNAGFYHRGDDPNTAGQAEHDWFTRTPTDNSGGPQLGDELFGFIPQELLPHLKWLTRPDYTHVYYADLKPKVTDARIFTPDADHPNGWGTILLGGFRLGGSCGACTSGAGAPPMTVTADFNGDGDTTDPNDTRTFYSAYFVLDITNPEAADYPRLLWSFSSPDLGLTTNTPSVLRVSPAGAARTDNASAKWYMLAASGPTGYDGSIAQAGKMFAVDIAQGPGVGNADVTVLAAESLDAFLGATVTVDRDFDYRVDVAYVGGTIDDGTPPWRGKLYRLTMNDCGSPPCAPDVWGISSGGTRASTELLDTFPSTNALELGPVAAAPAVTIDDAGRVWVFAGTGRLFDAVDKTSTEQQHFVGVKDPVLNGTCTESTIAGCRVNDLVDVSAAEVCLLGVGDCGETTDQVTGVSGATDFPSLINLVAAKDGWFTTLPGTGERVLARPVVFGGLVVFATYGPNGDPCGVGGNGFLYALHYRTGSAHSVPVIGTTTVGSRKHVNRSVSIGQGVMSEATIHVGYAGSHRQARVLLQATTGTLWQQSLLTATPITSRYLSWYDDRR